MKFSVAYSAFFMGESMDLTKGNIKHQYFKYLLATFGSSITASVYALVDMAMVGQYHGPSGTAALAVVAPLWNVIYSLGLLTGIGGAVILSLEKGKGSGQENKPFTAALIYSVVLAAICWVAVAFFDEPILIFFGADEVTLPLAREYLFPIKFGVPLFLFNQMLAAFLRNDNNPLLATIGVLAGGAFNVVGDYVFVFVCDMGAAGAGLATVLGALITFCVSCIHFFKKSCTLRLVKPTGFIRLCSRITTIGFSTFFIDVAMGILTVIFNKQIVKYLSNDALAVYGVVINISTIVQCCAYSIGQAAQPLFSLNLGAQNCDRIKQTLKYSLFTAAVFAVFWTGLSLAVPNGIVSIFMKTTDGVLNIAPAIIRRYAISFILLPFNVFSTYYFQELLKPVTAFVVSVLRGVAISGALILILPLISPDAIWYAMPITELVVVVIVAVFMVKYTANLSEIAKRHG